MSKVGGGEGGSHVHRKQGNIHVNLSNTLGANLPVEVKRAAAVLIGRGKRWPIGVFLAAFSLGLDMVVVTGVLPCLGGVSLRVVPFGYRKVDAGIAIFEFIPSRYCG